MKVTRICIVLLTELVMITLFLVSSFSESNADERNVQGGSSRSTQTNGAGPTTDQADNRAWTEASAKNNLDAYKMYLFN